MLEEDRTSDDTMGKDGEPATMDEYEASTKCVMEE